MNRAPVAVGHPYHSCLHGIFAITRKFLNVTVGSRVE